DAAAYSAVALFAERAAAARHDFALTPGNRAHVVDVCRSLDGLPLALELAAARTALLPVEQIAAMLDDRFRVLTGGSRTAQARHQTLLAAITWSYDLLSEPERKLLRRVSIFGGGWTLAAAEAVCADPAQAAATAQAGRADASLPAAAVLDRLGQLVAKSL